MQDHYNILGISVDASLDDIKAAYRQKAFLFHPDKNQSANAAEQFRLVKKAYDVLSLPDSRKIYDESRRRNLLEDPLGTAKKIWQNYLSKVLH